MKKRFSVKGTEKSLGTCRAAEDIPGNKMDIAASIGEEFDIIRKGKPIPDNKWLVKNKQGLYGFIDINKIEREADEDAEDLYEEVPASKIHSSHSSNGNNISTPPVSSPPPPPSQSAPRPPTGNQDIYDDVAAEQPDEELYEFLPE
ncbi:FYN-binding protein 1-like [Dendronephthya gigantea]|uniref:FYN-binding protein 1-like n=1 Tax=Dendronephthya gigantea TaxID=151771 RepID=UPI00106D7013|nr:FYN-binding protein 1-like [Dendronephthya gigantea]